MWAPIKLEFILSNIFILFLTCITKKFYICTENNYKLLYIKNNSTMDTNNNLTSANNPESSSVSKQIRLDTNLFDQVVEYAKLDNRSFSNAVETLVILGLQLAAKQKEAAFSVLN